MESVAYRVIEDIQHYNKLGGVKKELSNVTTKVFVMNQLSACQSNAVMALNKLQSHGVTEDQILSLSTSYLLLASATKEEAPEGQSSYAFYGTKKGGACYREEWCERK